MMHYQMHPTDPEEAELIQASLHFLQKLLQLHELSKDALIDVTRMASGATYGFII